MGYETGLRREKRQAEFLAALYSDKAAPVVLKGGGALRFVFESPRLSEDLDFNVLPYVMSDTLRHRIRNVLADLGWTYKETKQTETVLRWMVSVPAEPNLDPFKIEFSRRETGAESTTTRVRLDAHGMWMPTAIQHLDLDGMLTSKIDAMRSGKPRYVGRDIFDLGYILSVAEKNGVALSPVTDADRDVVFENMAETARHERLREDLLELLPPAYAGLDLDDLAVDVYERLPSAGGPEEGRRGPSDPGLSL